MHASSDIAAKLLSTAKAKGADAADLVIAHEQSLSVMRRHQKPEAVERAESFDIGLRVFVGHKSAIVSSTYNNMAHLTDMAEKAIAMARAVPDDEYAGLADPALLADTKNLPALDLYDPTILTPDEMVKMADEMEEAALAQKNITNSDGAECQFGHSEMMIATSHGFQGHATSSSYSLSVSVIAGADDDMQTGYEFDAKAHFADLLPAATIGRLAGRDAAEKLNPRKVKTQKTTVVYDPRVSGSLLSHLASALNGANIARGTSLLKDKMGARIFRPELFIFDDPLLPRGDRSQPFDGEGVLQQKRAIIENGKITSWFLDTASAKKLGLTSTGHAARGTSSPPSPRPTNFYLKPGSITHDEMIASITSGFLVTDLIGSSINMLTGDYSRGASGFWIENGKIAYPVAEVTIADNLIDMWARLIPASNLTHRYGIDAPSLMIEDMMIAGV
jgi:PmbA protein